MRIEQPTLENIAHLARLKLNPDEIPGLMADLEQILTWMEKLNELDTEGVEPLRHISLEINALREDLAKPPISPQTAMANAPTVDGRFFLVPKVIGA